MVDAYAIYKRVLNKWYAEHKEKFGYALTIDQEIKILQASIIAEALRNSLDETEVSK